MQIIVLDACFSGGFSNDLIRQPGRMALFSCPEAVVAVTAPEFRAGGYLAHFLSEALAGYGDLDRDGALAAWELVSYVGERYRMEVRDAAVLDDIQQGGRRRLP